MKNLLNLKGIASCMCDHLELVIIEDYLSIFSTYSYTFMFINKISEKIFTMQLRSANNLIRD